MLYFDCKGIAKIKYKQQKIIKTTYKYHNVTI